MLNGTRVIIRGTKSGCHGAEGRRGEITHAPHTSGLLSLDPGVNVLVDGGDVWRVNPDAVIAEDLDRENEQLREEIGRLRAERDAWKEAARSEFAETFAALVADKAALLDCVKWYTDLENWKLSQRARECIAKLNVNSK